MLLGLEQTLTVSWIHGFVRFCSKINETGTFPMDWITSPNTTCSYKSIAEPFDDWTLDELIGHYVNYRKQVSPSLDELLPKEQFQLYGVSTRFPQKLAGMVSLEPVQEGVYQVVWGTHPIRLLVLSEMPPAEQH